MKMEKKCSFGAHLKLSCMARRNNEQFDIDNLSLMEAELLKIRSGIANFCEITDICQHHKNQYLRDYSNNFRKCSDPFNIHQKIVATLEEYQNVTAK